MEQIINKSTLDFFSKPNRLKLWFGIFILIVGLSILQDYLYSQLRETGFYISESLLYNSTWFFLLPLTFIECKLLSYFTFKNKVHLLLFLLFTSFVLVLLHITLFTSFFVSVSYLVYSPSHHFIRIFKSALSSEFSIFTIYYFSVPFLLKFINDRIKKTADTSYSKQIKVKDGLTTVSVDTKRIESIVTNKPYTTITVANKIYFDTRTMKDFEAILDPDSFFRVHRSMIINKHLVEELKSRKNGDYDAYLSNGKTIRLSRHYRTRWKELLQ